METTITEQYTAPFVGREEDLDFLISHIHNDNCRLITVVGIGGIGKTRLIQEAVRKQVPSLPQQRYFIHLKSAAPASELASIVANHLNIPVHNPEEASSQLINYFSNKRALLIIDNFENLISPLNISFISQLIAQSPDLQIAITSREALNLREECLLSLSGIDVPDNNTITNANEYPAIQLFVEHAKQSDPYFDVANNMVHIIQICRIAEGLPLAIELCASWLRYMSCQQIYEEIAKDVNSIEATIINMPDRHRSMRIVFNTSWKLLSNDEQTTLKYLSLFRNDMDRAAIHYVANTDIHTIMNLVNKSLLRLGNDGQYHIHELLRQYCEYKLKQDDALHQDAEVRFYTYYGNFLRERTQGIMGNSQLKIMREISREIDNIYLAWELAIKAHAADFFVNAAQTLSLFLQFRSRYAEGVDLFTRAAQCMRQLNDEKTKLARLYLLVDWGWFDIRIGQLDRAQKTLTECLDIYVKNGISPVEGHGSDPRLPLSIISLLHGDFQSSYELGYEAYSIAQNHNHQSNLYMAHYVMASVLYAQGKFDKAKLEATDAYNFAQQAEDIWFVAYCLNVLGDVARKTKKFNDAQQYYLESYKIRVQFDDTEGMAVALKSLGQIALLQNNLEQAKQYYQESLQLYQQIQDRGGLAEVFAGLGQVFLTLKNYHAARQNLYKSLRISNEIAYHILTFNTLNHVSEWYKQTDQNTKSIKLASMIWQHPLSNHHEKQIARERLENLPEDKPLPAKDYDLDSLIVATLHDLADEALTLPIDEHKLAEPLTSRELEVLALIAQGLTNQEIAEALTIVVGTVKAHNHRIYRKLGVTNRTEAVAQARKFNLLT